MKKEKKKREKKRRRWCADMVLLRVDVKAEVTSG